MSEFLLIDAANEGDLEEVRKLLNDGYNVDEVDEEGYSPLIYAALNGHFEIVSLLIEYDAVIDHQDIGGWTALHFASTVKNHLPIVSLLIQNGAELDTKTNLGDTPLMRAAFYGYTPIVSLLLKNGADASLLDNRGKSALDKARQRNQSDCVVILQKYEHFHQYRKVWLSFATSLRSFKEDQNQESKQAQSQSQIRSPSLMRMLDSSDLVRFVTEFM